MFFLEKIPDLETIHSLTQRYSSSIDPHAIQSALYMLRVTSDILTTAEYNFAQYGISQGRFILMMLLNRDPEKGMTPSMLSEHARVTKATVTGLIDGLEREGYVARERKKQDRRTITIKLTKKGLKFLEEFLPIHFNSVSKLMRHLSHSERKQLLKLLEKIECGLDEFRITKENQETTE